LESRKTTRTNEEQLVLSSDNNAALAPSLTHGTEVTFKISTYRKWNWLGGEGYVAVNDRLDLLIVGKN
jgi:hypothetical protein